MQENQILCDRGGKDSQTFCGGKGGKEIQTLCGGRYGVESEPL